MYFNSVEFAIFLPIVFILYWFLFDKKIKQQNTLLLIASYIFYGCWDWRFLSLILFSSCIDYLVGLNLQTTANDVKRKRWLILSIAVNIGLLGFFKYSNFFIDSFVDTFTFFGRHLSVSQLSIILPVGISFYTFQTLSYSIDVYNKKLEPTKDAIAFFAFVSFFPQLVAGPIERASNLLPQFYKERNFDYKKAVDGLRQILWGLFKKVVIADNCAHYVNDIFNNYTEHSGSTLLLGAVLFAFQIYGDFSGYSDIAIGTSRLFGFDLKKNFAFPYFSRNIAEFWRRWHISLSTWFRDYIYIPLGGSKGSQWLQIRNVFIIFLVSGFWHGANWTFVLWGLFHAMLFLPLLLSKVNRNHLDIVAVDRYLPSLKELFQMGLTFFLVTITWVFFRADTVFIAFDYLKHLFSSSLFSIPDMRSVEMFIDISFVGLLIGVEWLQRNKEHGLELDNLKIPRIFKWIFYYFILLLILIYGGGQQEFIYFQF
jgi:D-alanyl-lipoteichoic acid acyltransferase DltB (MBOAT superfamily)